MQPDWESEHFVFCSESTVLECGCGEKLVLLGLKDDWRLEGRTVFECECGEDLTFDDTPNGEIESADGLDEEALDVRELLRSLKTPGA